MADGFANLNRRVLLQAVSALPLLTTPVAAGAAAQAADPLPSWNEGPAKAAIIALVRATTEPNGRDFVPPEARIAAFDQDGATWVEHPVYSQLLYCFDRAPEVVKAKPELRSVEPFKTVLSGDRARRCRLARETPGAAQLAAIMPPPFGSAEIASIMTPRLWRSAGPARQPLFFGDR
jgi:hypothetical protein